MFRITHDPLSGSIDSYLNYMQWFNSACCVRCRCLAAYSARAHTTGPTYAAKHRQRTQALLVEPLIVVSIKYESLLPDDGSCVIRNME
jgi:hypothetical protein